MSKIKLAYLDEEFGKDLRESARNQMGEGQKLLDTPIGGKNASERIQRAKVALAYILGYVKFKATMANEVGNRLTAYRLFGGADGSAKDLLSRGSQAETSRGVSTSHENSEGSSDRKSKSQEMEDVSKGTGTVPTASQGEAGSVSEKTQTIRRRAKSRSATVASKIP